MCLHGWRTADGKVHDFAVHPAHVLLHLESGHLAKTRQTVT